MTQRRAGADLLPSISSAWARVAGYLDRVGIPAGDPPVGPLDCLLLTLYLDLRTDRVGVIDLACGPSRGASTLLAATTGSVGVVRIPVPDDDPVEDWRDELAEHLDAIGPDARCPVEPFLPGAATPPGPARRRDVLVTLVHLGGIGRSEAARRLDQAERLSRGGPIVAIGLGATGRCPAVAELVARSSPAASAATGEGEPGTSRRLVLFRELAGVLGESRIGLLAADPDAEATTLDRVEAVFAGNFDFLRMVGATCRAALAASRLDEPTRQRLVPTGTRGGVEVDRALQLLAEAGGERDRLRGEVDALLALAWEQVDEPTRARLLPGVVRDDLDVDRARLLLGEAARVREQLRADRERLLSGVWDHLDEPTRQHALPGVAREAVGVDQALALLDADARGRDGLRAEVGRLGAWAGGLLGLVWEHVEEPARQHALPGVGREALDPEAARALLLADAQQREALRAEVGRLGAWAGGLLGLVWEHVEEPARQHALPGIGREALDPEAARALLLADAQGRAELRGEVGRLHEEARTLLGLIWDHLEESDRLLVLPDLGWDAVGIEQARALLDADARRRSELHGEVGRLRGEVEGLLGLVWDHVDESTRRRLVPGADRGSIGVDQAPTLLGEAVRDRETLRTDVSNLLHHVWTLLQERDELLGTIEALKLAIPDPAPDEEPTPAPEPPPPVAPPPAPSLARRAMAAWRRDGVGGVLGRIHRRALGAGRGREAGRR